MDIKNKLEKIIPPDDFQHRYEFSNQHMIDELDIHEKKEIEDLLIKKLYLHPGDTLIIETLSYMRSEKAIPAMRISLENCEIPIQKIIISVSIYKINNENKMIDIAIDAFKQLYNKWDLVIVFSYLKGFNDRRINDLIKEYIDNPDFLISHNAKRALGIIKD
jgi:hypothetical protein